MKFAYEDLSDDQFERLIVFLCQRLLGISVQGFAKGPDGGRDGKFVGNRRPKALLLISACTVPARPAQTVGDITCSVRALGPFSRSLK